MKTEDKKRDNIKWGSLTQVPSINNHIVQSAWKDNAVVLMLSTIHEPITLDPALQDDSIIYNAMYKPPVPGDVIGQSVVRTRRRPKVTSSAAHTARKAFGNSPTKDLPIPIVIDEYNHNMGSVDVADQLRGSMAGMRRIRKGGWRALWQFIFNLVVLNSFLLSQSTSQFNFRNALIDQLLEKGLDSGLRNRSRNRKYNCGNSQGGTNSEQQHQGIEHKLGYRGKHQYCTQCRVVPNKSRVLSEVSDNLQGRRAVKRSQKRQRRKKGVYVVYIVMWLFVRKAIASILM